jgi:CubicO group peptidase (beta-lactamase class C family)
MKKEIYTFCRQKIMLLFALLMMGVWSFSQGFSPNVTARLQQLLDSIQNSATNPVIGGMSVVIDVDGLAVWQGVTGYAARNVDVENNLLPGGVPMTKETVSHMYSVTKTFTSALVLELAREGAFSLEDPVSKYIPFLPYVNAALDGSVTIRQLMAHESGWSDYQDEPMIAFAVAAMPDKVFTPYEVLSFVHQVAPKGGPRRYASTNYITLGAIIENATGKPVEIHYRERFLTPLGLNSIYLSVREPGRPGELLASPHDNFYPLNDIFAYLGSPYHFPYEFTNVSGLPFTAIHSMAFTGGGLVGNAADMAKWGNALYGGRATSDATRQAIIESIDDVPDPDGDYLGYGIYANSRVSTTDYFYGHQGRAPGYRSVMWYQPDRKMTISILTNFSGLDVRLGGLSPYDIAKVLYAAIPNFIGGNENRKEAKIILCHNGKEIMVDRSAAGNLIKKGAYLGPCDEMMPEMPVRGVKNESTLSVYPNPALTNAIFTIKAAESGKVMVRLIDPQGQVSRILYNGNMEKGATQVVTLATYNYSPGLYTTQMITSSGMKQVQLIIAK